MVSHWLCLCVWQAFVVCRTDVGKRPGRRYAFPNVKRRAGAFYHAPGGRILGGGNSWSFRHAERYKKERPSLSFTFSFRKLLLHTVFCDHRGWSGPFVFVAKAHAPPPSPLQPPALSSLQTYLWEAAGVNVASLLSVRAMETCLTVAQAMYVHIHTQVLCETYICLI